MILPQINPNLLTYINAYRTRTCNLLPIPLGQKSFAWISSHWEGISPDCGSCLLSKPLSLFLRLSPIWFTSPVSSPPSSNNSTPNRPLETIFHSWSFQLQRQVRGCPTGLSDQPVQLICIIIRVNRGYWERETLMLKMRTCSLHATSQESEGILRNTEPAQRNTKFGTLGWA